jgi:hypothetical protein
MKIFFKTFFHLFYSQVYYIERQGVEYKILAEITYNETVERFPPNVTAAVKAPDNLIYFFRDEKYCKRPLNGSSLNLKRPQFVNYRSILYVFKSFFNNFLENFNPLVFVE